MTVAGIAFRHERTVGSRFRWIEAREIRVSLVRMGRYGLPQSFFDSLDEVLDKHHGDQLTDEHFDLNDETGPRDLVSGMELMPDIEKMDRVKAMFVRGKFGRPGSGG